MRIADVENVLLEMERRGGNLIVHLTRNLFNNTNFGTPAANISNPNVGIITIADEARYMQLAMRIVW